MILNQMEKSNDSVTYHSSDILFRSRNKNYVIDTYNNISIDNIALGIIFLVFIAFLTFLVA